MRNRYGLELTNVTNLFAGTTIAAFAETVAKGGKVQAMNAKGLAGLNAREYEMLEEEAMKMGAKVRTAHTEGTHSARTRCTQYRQHT